MNGGSIELLVKRLQILEERPRVVMMIQRKQLILLNERLKFSKPFDERRLRGRRSIRFHFIYS